MLERLQLKRSERPSSEGRKPVSSVVKIFRGSLVACMLTVPSLSMHTPVTKTLHDEHVDYRSHLLETWLQELFEDTTVVNVVRVFAMSPDEFRKAHPEKYEHALRIADALCMEPSRFQETYNQFIHLLCHRAQSDGLVLPEMLARKLFSESMVKDELVTLLGHEETLPPGERIVLAAIQGHRRVTPASRVALVREVP